MKRKHLLLLSLLLSQSTPLWGMGPEENNSKLLIRRIDCKESDFKGQIPTRQYCQKALNLSKLSSILNFNQDTDRGGGNGVVSFTTDKKYAVKREVDINAGIQKKNKVDILSDVTKIVNDLEIKGFVMNLPVSLFHIYRENKQCAPCNIQIFPQVKTVETKDVAGIIKHYLQNPNSSLKALNIIESLGKKLAKFQQTTKIRRNNNIDIGLQHGDFHPENILITKINPNNGETDFTLIDNGDFRVNGRLISDPVYFFYWTGEFLLSHLESPDLNRFKAITRSFFSGYIENLPAKVVEHMKQSIFDKGIIGPLTAAFSGDFFSFRGRRHFLNTEKWSKKLASMQHDGFIKAYNSRFKKHERSVVSYVYKIENKWHRDQGLSSFLDADSHHPNGRIYRSGYDCDNTSWYLTPRSDGSYKIENKWHRDQGLPSSLDADSRHPNGIIYRSDYDSDNTSWYLTPRSDGSYKIENKWYRDQGLPSSLDADSGHPNGIIYRSDYDSDNTSWYLTPVLETK